MDLRATLLDLDAALTDAGVDHALIGGLALAAHGGSRATVDVDFLFATRAHARAMLERSSGHVVLGRQVLVVDPSDLVGLKVQSSSNDSSRRHRDLADIEWLLAHPDVELGRVRDYFRLFDREKELEALLAERGR